MIDLNCVRSIDQALGGNAFVGVDAALALFHPEFVLQQLIIRAGVLSEQFLERFPSFFLGACPVFDTALQLTAFVGRLADIPGHLDVDATGPGAKFPHKNGNLPDGFAQGAPDHGAVDLVDIDCQLVGVVVAGFRASIAIDQAAHEMRNHGPGSFGRNMAGPGETGESTVADGVHQGGPDQGIQPEAGQSLLDPAIVLPERQDKSNFVQDFQCADKAVPTSPTQHTAQGRGAPRSALGGTNILLFSLVIDTDKGGVAGQSDFLAKCLEGDRTCFGFIAKILGGGR